MKLKRLLRWRLVRWFRFVNYGRAVQRGVNASINADYQRHLYFVDWLFRKHYMEPIRAMLNEPSPLLRLLERG